MLANAPVKLISVGTSVGHSCSCIGADDDDHENKDEHREDRDNDDDGDNIYHNADAWVCVYIKKTKKNSLLLWRLHCCDSG